MTVITSCGHRLKADEDSFNLSVKDYYVDMDGERRSIRYATYCTTCRDKLLAIPEYVLHTDEDEMNWLCGKD